MSNKYLSQSIFGSFDGLTSALGVVVATVSTSRHQLLVTMTGLAVAAAIGMGAGEWLGDNTSDYKAAAVMAISTFIGTFAPAIPFFFLPRSSAIVAVVAICIVTAIIIGHNRVTTSVYKSYIQTLSILALVAVITIATSVALGTS